MNFNPKVDAYISNSADFAKPILEHFRQIIHETCPLVEEKIKWGMPFFDYKGEMMCHLAAFKQHCTVGFWKASLMKDPILLENAKTEQAMGHLGKITSIETLPDPAKLASYIMEAMALNDKGIKIVKPKVETKKEIITPADFELQINENEAALIYFEKASYSFKKEYIQWIEDAKTESTRNNRIHQAVEWVAEGKGKNWKYETK